MSHFTVMVAGDNVEDQLAPFQENNMGDCPQEFLEFNDETELVEQGWEEDTVNLLEVDGKRAFNYSADKNTFYREVSEEEYNAFEGKKTSSGLLGKDSVYLVLRDEVKEIEIPVKEHYGSLEDYADKYHGYKRDPNTGKFGYWENPNRKWDWYQVGGRWSGFLLLKTGERANDALKGEVDWEGMRKEAADEARETYRKAMGETPLRPLWESWDDVRERFGMNRIDEAREFYRSQEGIKAVKKNVDNPFFYRIDKLLVDEETYVGAKADAAIATYAFLKDGKWFQKGEMGWFGMSSDEMSEEDWNKLVWQQIQNLPDDMRITVVDCHI